MLLTRCCSLCAAAAAAAAACERSLARVRGDSCSSRSSSGRFDFGDLDTELRVEYGDTLDPGVPNPRLCKSVSFRKIYAFVLSTLWVVIHPFQIG
jgi:hypothetical protein